MGGTSFHTSGSTCCSTGTTLTFHISRTWKGFTCHRWPFRAHVINSINHSNSRENTPCLVYHVSQNSQSHAMGGTFIGERRLSLGHDRRHATHTPNSVGFLPTNPKTTQVHKLTTQNHPLHCCSHALAEHDERNSYLRHELPLVHCSQRLVMSSIWRIVRSGLPNLHAFANTQSNTARKMLAFKNKRVIQNKTKHAIAPRECSHPRSLQFAFHHASHRDHVVSAPGTPTAITPRDHVVSVPGAPTAITR